MTRSSRHGIPDTHFFLLRHGPSPGAHGGTRGTGIHGITEYHGTEIHGMPEAGGVRGTGTHGITILGITDHTGVMIRTGTITTGITIIPEYGITTTIQAATYTMAPETLPGLSAPGARQYPDPEVRPDQLYPEAFPEYHAVRQPPAVRFLG